MEQNNPGIKERMDIAVELAELLEKRTKRDKSLQYDVVKIAMLLLGQDWQILCV